MTQPRLAVNLTAQVARFKRRPCPACGLRRILYRIEVRGEQGELPTYGAALCSGCAGLRP